MDINLLTTALTDPLHLNQEPNLPALPAALASGDLQLSHLHPLLTHRNLWAAVDKTSATDPGVTFSTTIEGQLKAAALKAVQNVNRRLQTEGQLRQLFTKTDLFEGIANQNDKIVKSGKFRGLALKVSEAAGMEVKIDRIGFQADATQAGLNIYVFHSSQEAHIAKKVVEITRTGSFSWADLNVTLTTDEYEPGGLFYIGYFEDDLIGSLVQKKVDINKPCGSCSPKNQLLQNKWNQAVSVHPFYVDANHLSGLNRFDPYKAQWKQEANMGLNLTLSAQCNLNGFWYSESDKLARLVGLEAAVNLLNLMVYSTQTGGVKNDTQQKAQMEFTRTTKGDGGIIEQLEQEYKAVIMGVQGLNAFCLPCKHSPVRVGGR